MGLWNSICGWFGSRSIDGCGSHDINPSTGLPMIDGSGVDVGGSPYGVDIHHDDCWATSSSSWDDSFSSSGGSWDD